MGNRPDHVWIALDTHRPRSSKSEDLRHGARAAEHLHGHGEPGDPRMRLGDESADARDHSHC
jgi:hypothetical protein